MLFPSFNCVPGKKIKRRNWNILVTNVLTDSVGSIYLGRGKIQIELCGNG